MLPAQVATPFVSGHGRPSAPGLVEEQLDDISLISLTQYRLARAKVEVREQPAWLPGCAQLINCREAAWPA